MIVATSIMLRKQKLVVLRMTIVSQYLIRNATDGPPIFIFVQKTPELSVLAQEVAFIPKVYFRV